VPFSYYDRLSRRAKATYRKSDAVKELPLADVARLQPSVAALAAGLAADDKRAVQRAARALVDGLCRDLEIEPVIVRVLARRPANATEELHGLYEREDGETAIVRVWMRTAAQKRVVAFRTFLRTLLHEVCHHVDYERLELADSLHTEGFFRRESSLVRQLAGPGRRRRPMPEPEPEPEAAPAPSRKTARVQLPLPGVD
jgi:hypothetical protein